MKLHLDKYLDRGICDSVKGLFILTVFYSHLMSYFHRKEIVLGGPIIPYLDMVSGLLGQLIVVMFLFYSGYGVAYSITKKGSDYVASMPRKRLGHTLLNFMVAVAIFLVLQTAVLQKDFSFTHIILSFTGWESVGNSNWYIFVILLCYALNWLIYRLLPNRGGG